MTFQVVDRALQPTCCDCELLVMSDFLTFAVRSVVVRFISAQWWTAPNDSGCHALKQADFVNELRERVADMINLAEKT